MMRLTALALMASIGGLLVIATGEFVTSLAEPAEDSAATSRIRDIDRLTAERMKAVDQLLDGEATASQAASRFRDLCASTSTESLRWLEIEFPDASCEAELHFRHVLLYAEARVEQRRLSSGRLDVLRQEIECRRNRDNWSSRELSPGP